MIILNKIFCQENFFILIFYYIFWPNDSYGYCLLRNNKLSRICKKFTNSEEFLSRKFLLLKYVDIK